MSDVLFNFTDPIISASVLILKENTLNQVVYIQRGTGSLATPRVELQATTGDHLNHVHITSVSSSVYDAYNGTLQASVVTNRSRNDSDHMSMVSKVTNVLSNVSNYVNRMTNHHMLRINKAGSSQTINDDRTTDITNLQFSYQVIIKESAW